MLSLPSVEGVRLATVDDLHRIALVAASAFFWSPTFQFQRPRYRDFPADTVASYLFEYEAAIHDPACVVLVAEDIVERDEVEYIYEALQGAFQAQDQTERAIVGVCSISLKPNSVFLGHLQPRSKPTAKQAAQSDRSPSRVGRCRPPDRKRDQCAVAMELYNTATQPAKLQHLHGKMRLSTLAVAPAYWRRGHASRLVDFCTQLADSDEAILGVSATPRGALVVKRAGFSRCELVHVKHPTISGKLGDEAFLDDAGLEAQATTDVQLWSVTAHISNACQLLTDRLLL
ncbi:hypothetical protein T440DRAFT_500269 [Plenodomus tracheiphilus IPT5]|uniref:N-acetyltransferase domain-containing protein n=1 Tax=Plenodomus tracheiphilus IPT5 TaxID=1408161 RepID=A0A6A7B012_9PLEO|nr:hypothetical protein T440DRAFT_500269 [Plenodomus tracheiphilus IPT5]